MKNYAVMLLALICVSCSLLNKKIHPNYNDAIIITEYEVNDSLRCVLCKEAYADYFFLILKKTSTNDNVSQHDKKLISYIGKMVNIDTYQVPKNYVKRPFNSPSENDMNPFTMNYAVVVFNYKGEFIDLYNDYGFMLPIFLSNDIIYKNNFLYLKSSNK